MLLQVPKILDADRLALFRDKLAAATWVDGRATAGAGAAKAKSNLQVDGKDPLARELGAIVLDALSKSPMFFSGALPRHILPPQFNRYVTGQSYGAHVDNALRHDRRTQPPKPVRADLSATLFLSDPSGYDGGELVIQTTFGAQSAKLPAGDLLLYPASSVHRVTPVTRGERIACFFWVQSMVRDDGERAVLYDLDLSIRRLEIEHPEASTVDLLAIYNNLLRRWSEV